MSKPFRFDDPEFVQRYAEGPSKFVPGYAVMHRLVIQLLHERAGADAHVLVLGAGGGMELSAFAAAMPDWSFTGVDPSAQMLAQAKRQMGEAQARVTWVEGVITDAPDGPFDAATCLLTLHLLAEDAKRATLRSILQRLKPGAPFAVVDNCIGSAPDAQVQLDRYARFALVSGVDPADVARARAGVEAMLPCSLTPAREEALLREAGLSNVELFFAGLSWRGWIAHA